MKIQKLTFLFLLTAFLLGTFFVFTPQVFAATHVSSDINTDTTWVLADSPYVIDNEIYISNGAIFNIEPGVVVKFAPYSSIVIDSESEASFLALGTTEQKIYFTSLADDTIGGDTNGDGSATTPDITENSTNIWYGINAMNGFNVSTLHIHLKNVVIRYADTGLKIYRVPDVVIQDSIFENNNHGIYDGGDSHVNISNTEIKNNKIGVKLNQADYLPSSIYQTNTLSLHDNTDYAVLNETHGADQARNNNNLFWRLMDLFKPNKVLADTYDYTVDFRNTWWGDASGPKNIDTNVNGLGNNASNLVSYYPWLTTDPNATCCSSVLFLPGLEASRLYKQKTILGFPIEDQLWEPNLPSDVEDLYLNPDGTSKNQNIYTRDIIGSTNVLGPFFTQNIYKSLISQLNNEVSLNKISNWESYAYDWRQGIDDLIQNGTKYNDDQIFSLIGTLQSLVNTSKNGKVAIIAHSNGGLLAKALIKKLEDMKSLGQGDLIDHIDSLVMVAVPQLGTPGALSALLHGYKQSLPLHLMSEIQARKLAKNMNSAYGLLPSRKYFDQTEFNPLGVFDSTMAQIYKTSYGDDINNYTEEYNFILGQEGRIQPAESNLISPIKGNSALLSKAEILHDSIDNMNYPSSLKVIEIAGWGKDTILGITYSDSDIQPIYTFKGDKTVVMQSALYGQGTKYWLDLSNSTLNHGNILEDSQLLSFIKSTIEQQILNPSIGNTQPTQTRNRLHISVHSPVSLGMYDNQGNFTGKVCDDITGNCIIKEEIPGSTYFNFGEGKYISLPEEKMKSVKLQGIDVGTFTYDSEKVLPDGTSTVSSFVDIPVTTQTQAEVTLNQVGVPQLALDVTGDGTIDFTINPNTAFDPILFLQVMKKTIESFDISNQQKNKFTKRINDTIKAIQQGKINKAKIKIEQFKKALVLHPGENDKDRKERENKNEREHEKEHKEHKKPKKLSSNDAQLLLDMLNKLLDNLN